MQRGDFKESVPAVLGAAQSLRLNLRVEPRSAPDEKASGELELRIRQGDGFYSGDVVLEAPDGERKASTDSAGVVLFSDLLSGEYFIRLKDRPSSPPTTFEPVRLDPPALFGFDKDVLDATNLGKLSRIVEALTKHDERGALLRLECRGHTDSTGSNQYNNDLSLKRAIACKSALRKELEQSGVGPRLQGKVEIVTNARGELSGTGAGQRRVEFWLEKRNLLGPK